MVNIGDITKQDQADMLPVGKRIYVGLDVTATSDVSVTGVGFKPSWVYTTYFASGDRKVGGVGVGIDNLSNSMVFRTRDNTVADTIGCDGYLFYGDYPGTDYYAYIKSFDSDGFTIEVDSAVAGADTLNCYVICFK
jgi:hypothetical protein